MNPARRSHQLRFAETCNELLNVHPIEEEIEIVENEFNRAKIEHLDKETSIMLRKARSKAEGDKRGMPGIPEKNKIRGAMLCWKLRLMQRNGKVITRNNLERRREEAELTHEGWTPRTQLKEKHNVATNEWNDFKDEKKKEHEEMTLDYYEDELPNETDKDKKRRKHVMKNIKQTLRKNHGFNHLTENAGKGKKIGLRNVIVI